MVEIGFEWFESSEASSPCLAASEILRGVEITVGEKFAKAGASVLSSEAICIGRSARKFLLNVSTR